MQNGQISLLRTAKFLPLFLTQFFGSFNDNVYKSGILILLSYKIASVEESNIMATIAGGLFILPFLIFSATAGQLADKYEKSGLIQKIKLAEIFIMGIGSLGIMTSNIYLMFLMLFLMGAQSTFFGPIKFSILPEALTKDQLIAGNALIEAGTFFAILLGSVAGGAVFIVGGAANVVLSIAVILIAIAGWYSSLSIPKTKPKDPNLIISWNIISETISVIETARKNSVVMYAILGTSWFWLVGATFLTQFPGYTKDIIGGSETIVTLLLSIFSIGIAAGCMFCDRLLKSEINPTYVPLGILLISFFLIDLYFASKGYIPDPEHKLSIMEFLSIGRSYRVLFDLFALSLSSGLYIVPLYAIMQYYTKEKFRSRVLGASNIINAVFMVIASLVTVLLFQLCGFNVLQLFLFMAFCNTVVAIYIVKILPDALIRSVLRMILKTLYRVEVSGKENFHAAGKRVLIISNHTSFLDGVLLVAFFPEKVTFAISPIQARRWWIKPLLSLVRTFAINPAHPIKTKTLIKDIRSGLKVVIFPEGRLTETGSLMKIYEGPGMIADKSDAMILPVRIDGAQHSIFSRLRGKLRIKLFPKITITILEPVKFEIDSKLQGRERRVEASKKLYDIMSLMIFESSDYQKTVFEALIDARNTHGFFHRIAEDIKRKPIIYGMFILKSFTLGAILKRKTTYGKNVGIMLPNMIATLLTFYGLQAFGRIPAMINFSAGVSSILHACKISELKTVITSRKFILSANLEEIVQAMQSNGIKIIILEDLAKGLHIFSKIFGIFASLFPLTCFHLIQRVAEIKRGIDYNNPSYNLCKKPAVILFTSGSEGKPKGVVLSHANLLANCYQLLSIIDLNPSDNIFNVLPVFHTFGLLGGAILPIMSGIKVFEYPSPLHYRVIPELIYDTDTTIFFATDTFLAGYAKYAHPYDFYSIRYVIAGAEKLKDETRKLWADRFGVRIFEGYGCTETSPGVAINTPMHFKIGTVGRIFPGMKFVLDKIEGVENGGRLIVSGPNIMLGYLDSTAENGIKFPEYKFSNPDIVKKCKGEKWYDTGDVVLIDDEGYIKIIDRLKRFAKIGGEMVSLMAVETYINEIIQMKPEDIIPGVVTGGTRNAIISLDDEKKGEQLVLVTNVGNAEREMIVTHFKKMGYAELSIPKKIIYMKDIPLLGSGKTDYIKLKELITSGNY